MSVGSEIIGSDHRALIELINRVGDIAAGKGSAEIGNVLDGPIAYFEFYYAPEESMMVAFGYTGAERHFAEHASFTDHISSIGQLPKFNFTRACPRST
tara:strand:- start:196 stop:489 length:294 start_codon:yes stop_codon:yes gene_type:complete